MGEIFVARQLASGGFSRLVVAKRTGGVGVQGTMDPALQREARVAAHLQHRNLVQVLDFEQIDEVPYLIMEVVDGPSAAELCARAGPLPLELAAGITASVADGLHAVHEARDDEGRALELVHRDVSPDNVLLSWAGDVKLADFGLAFSGLWSRLTRTGTVKGKLHYMSPEQLRAERVTRSTDVYALGAVLYHLLSGRPPFAAWLEDAALSHAVLFIPAPPLPLPVPDALGGLLRRALAKSAEDRPASAADFARDLRQACACADGSTLARFLEENFPPGDKLRLRVKAPERVPSTPERVTAAFPVDAAEPLEVMPASISAPTVSLTPTGGSRPRAASRVHSRVARRRRLVGALVMGAAVVVVTALGWWRNEDSPRVAALPPAMSQMPTSVAAAATAVEGPAPVTAAPVPEVNVAPSPSSHVAKEPPAVSTPSKRPGGDRALGARRSRLTVRSTVSCALSAGGKALGKVREGHPLDVELPTGPASIRCVSASEGLDFTRPVRINHGGPTELSLSPQKATLRIRVAPWGRVQLDGKDLGLTPIAPMAVYEGRHELEAVHPPTGRRAARTLTLKPGQTEEARFNFAAE